MSISSQLNSIFSKAVSKAKKRNLRQKYSRFNGVFLVSALAPMLAVGLFNVAIDPYDVFKTPDFWGVNHSKPKKDNNDRLFKALDIIRIKPVAIFIGSSRTKQGLDPNHPAFKNYQPAYNLALNGPNFYEQRRYLQHAIANQKDLKEVILGADFFMFNEFLNNQASFSENRLGKQYLTPEDAINSIFSWDAFSASQETISDSQKNPKDDVNYGRNGFFPVRDIDKKITEWRFEAGLNLYLELHSNYQLSDKYLADFKSFVELCKQKGITLKVFISPAHATDLEAIRTTGQWQTFEQWKRDIVQIVPVWDFSGYNSVTTEPISNHMINYVDNSHYTPKIGDLVLNRVLSYQDETVPKDFGILLTPENVESHIAKIRADREVWANKNPDEVKLVKDIKQEYDAKQALAPK